MQKAQGVSDAPIVESRNDQTKEGNRNDIEELENKNLDVYVF